MTIERNLCNRCGKPAPILKLGLEGLSEIRHPYCHTCADAVNRERAEADRLKRVQGLIARAGVAKRWRNWSLDTYPDDERARAAKVRAVEWFEDFAWGDASGNLLLLGGVGSGKTGLAWSLVRRACEEEIPARLVNFSDHLAAVKRSFSTGEYIDDSWQRMRLLVLDDLGSERPTDFARDELLHVVDYRHRNELPTIVTSNYALSDLGKRLGHDEETIGQRIVSRLADGATQIKFDAIERRRLRAA